MSEEADITGGDKKDVSGGSPDPDSKTQTKKDSVSYETYKKVLDEKKATDAKLAEFNARLEAAEQEKLAESGKYKDLFESTQKKLKAREDGEKELIRTFGRTNLTNSLRAKLAEQGCLDTDFAIRGLDLSEAKFTDGFNVDQDYVKEIVDSLVETKQFLFKKTGTQVNDRNPAAGTKTVVSSAQLRYGAKK